MKSLLKDWSTELSLNVAESQIFNRPITRVQSVFASDAACREAEQSTERSGGAGGAAHTEGYVPAATEPPVTAGPPPNPHPTRSTPPFPAAPQRLP